MKFPIINRLIDTSFVPFLPESFFFHNLVYFCLFLLTRLLASFRVYFFMPQAVKYRNRFGKTVEIILVKNRIRYVKTLELKYPSTN